MRSSAMLNSVAHGHRAGSRRTHWSAAVDEAAGKLEERGADGAGDGELLGGVHAAESGGPTDQVVS